MEHIVIWLHLWQNNDLVHLDNRLSDYFKLDNFCFENYEFTKYVYLWCEEICSVAFM